MVFAFRAFIASRMNTLMKADARVLFPKLGPRESPPRSESLKDGR